MTVSPGILFMISRPVAAYEQASIDAGIGPVCFEPPLTFTFRSMAQESISQATGIILSSQTAVESLSSYDVEGKDCWAIGSATAAAARRQGLTVRGVVEGGGARFVAALSQAKIVLPARGLVWPTAEQPAFELDQALRQHGIQTKRLTAYRAQAKQEPSDQTRAWLNRHPSAVAALFSKGCMQAFEQWIRRSDIFWQPSAILAIGPRVVNHACLLNGAPVFWPPVATREAFARLVRDFSLVDQGRAV